MMDGQLVINRLTRQACRECHDRKVRCIPTADNISCKACHEAKTKCIPRTRKKRQSNHTLANKHAKKASTPKLPVISPQDNAVQSQNLHIDTSEARYMQQNYPFSPSSNPQTSASSVPALQHASPQHPDTATFHAQFSSIQATIEHEAETTPRSCSNATYIGREHYIGADEPINEEAARSFVARKGTGLSPIEEQTLKLWDALSLPPKAVHNSLVDSFVQYCYPWMPILDSWDVKHPSAAGLSSPQPSYLVLQALFLAASQVSSSPLLQFSGKSEPFYDRAKLLFWLGHEKDPILVIKASIMLQWFNPEGPEHVSLDNSEFWLKTGVGLAYQIGLHKEPAPGPQSSIRRRLWWTLVARDSLISVSHGRPRAIHLEDSDVLPPSIVDFPNAQLEADTFSCYVRIARLLGDIADSCMRKSFSKMFETFENALLKWSRTLPKQLHLVSTDLSGGHLMSSLRLNAKQLHLPYFTSLLIMARSRTRRDHISTVAVLAASFVSGIFEDFLARDEIKVLAPVFTIYCLSSGLALLSLYPYPELWEAAQEDFQMIEKSLVELSKRWRSAIGASKALKATLEARSKIQRAAAPLKLRWLDDEEQLFLQCGPRESCRLWNVVHQQTATSNISNFADIAATGSDVGFSHPTSSGNTSTSTVLPTVDPLDDPTVTQFQYDYFGSWLFSEQGWFTDESFGGHLGHDIAYSF